MNNGDMMGNITGATYIYILQLIKEGHLFRDFFFLV